MTTEDTGTIATILAIKHVFLANKNLTLSSLSKKLNTTYVQAIVTTFKKFSGLIREIQKRTDTYLYLHI